MYPAMGVALYRWGVTAGMLLSNPTIENENQAPVSYIKISRADATI